MGTPRSGQNRKSSAAREASFNRDERGAGFRHYQSSRRSCLLGVVGVWRLLTG
jgi:hypothetical protein